MRLDGLEAKTLADGGKMQTNYHGEGASLKTGIAADASYPVIVSASRRTDIPAFYMDWFFHRLEKGFCDCVNPFNRQKRRIVFARTQFIVFWSKNPEVLLANPRYGDFLHKRNIGFYILYSLNDYENTGLEPAVPPLARRIDCFRRLVDRFGMGSVVWRFDPLVLMDNLDMENLLDRVENIGRQLKDHTEKLVFSFVDILSYRKVQTRLAKNNMKCEIWTEERKKEFARKLLKLKEAHGWPFTLSSCGEGVWLDGIEPNRCIDDSLILRRCGLNPWLLEYLGAEEADSRHSLLPNAISAGHEKRVATGNGKYFIIRKSNRDPGQRKNCGCVKSTDIGEYGTCAHFCRYCYANPRDEAVMENRRRHGYNPTAETIRGI